MDNTPITHLINAVDAVTIMEELHCEILLSKDEKHRQEKLHQMSSTLLAIKGDAYELTKAYGINKIVEDIVDLAEGILSNAKEAPIAQEEIVSAQQEIAGASEVVWNEPAANAMDVYRSNMAIMKTTQNAVRTPMLSYQPEPSMLTFKPGQIIRTPFKANAGKDYPTMPIYFYVHSLGRNRSGNVLKGWRLSEQKKAVRKYMNMRDITPDQFTIIVEDNVSLSEVGLDELLQIGDSHGGQ